MGHDASQSDICLTNVSWPSLAKPYPCLAFTRDTHVVSQLRPIKRCNFTLKNISEEFDDDQQGVVGDSTNLFGFLMPANYDFSEDFIMELRSGNSDGTESNQDVSSVRLEFIS